MEKIVMRDRQAIYRAEWPTSIAHPFDLWELTVIHDCLSGITKVEGFGSKALFGYMPKSHQRPAENSKAVRNVEGLSKPLADLGIVLKDGSDEHFDRIVYEIWQIPGREQCFKTGIEVVRFMNRIANVFVAGPVICLDKKIYRDILVYPGPWIDEASYIMQSARCQP